MDAPTIVRELAPGIFLWRARHPEWHSTSELVACHVLVSDEGVAIVDPMLDPDGGVLEWLRSIVRPNACAIYVTIPYHVRDSVELARELDAPVVGDRRVQRRLEPDVRFIDASATSTLPLDMRMLAIGKPRRAEMPLYSPAHRALCLGDVAVGIGGGLRLWQVLDSPARKTWWQERFLPSLEPMLELDVEHVLVAHGTPVAGTGRAALREMVDEPPVEFRVSMLDAEAVPDSAVVEDARA